MYLNPPGFYFNPLKSQARDLLTLMSSIGQSMNPFKLQSNNADAQRPHRWSVHPDGQCNLCHRWNRAPRREARIMSRAVAQSALHLLRLHPRLDRKRDHCLRLQIAHAMRHDRAVIRFKRRPKHRFPR